MTEHSRHMSTRTSSTIQRRTPINDWKYDASDVDSSVLTSSSARYDVYNGVFAFAGRRNRVSPKRWRSVRQVSTFFTACCTYCEDPNAHAITPVSNSTCRTFPPRYIFGGPMFTSFSLKYFPTPYRSAFSGCPETHKQSSVYRRMYS